MDSEMKRGTLEHPKMARLIRLLDIERWGAAGLLESIWQFTAKYAIQGDIGRWSNQEIADGIGWSGRHGTPDEMISALIESRWLDCCRKHRLVVHDWAEHCDDSVRKTMKNRNLSFLFPEMDGTFPENSGKVAKEKTEGMASTFGMGGLPSLSFPSLSSPSPSSPDRAGNGEGEEGDSTNGKPEAALIAYLRNQPFGLTEAARAVAAAVDHGCTIEQIQAVADFWRANRPRWNQGQLCRRIEKALPTDEPTAAWPKPDKNAAVGRPAVDHVTEQTNREFLAKQKVKA